MNIKSPVHCSQGMECLPNTKAVGLLLSRGEKFACLSALSCYDFVVITPISLCFTTFCCFFKYMYIILTFQPFVKKNFDFFLERWGGSLPRPNGVALAWFSFFLNISILYSLYDHLSTKTLHFLPKNHFSQGVGVEPTTS